jgi:hypothetical protein
MYDETLEICSGIINSIDENDTDMHPILEELYRHIFNCYFRLSNAAECKKALEYGGKFIIDDINRYRNFQNQIRLAINTGEEQRVLPLIEQSIGFWKSIDRTVSVADLLVLKGRATKEIKYFKEALMLYKEAPEDTTDEERIATMQMKELRHLS